MAASYPTPMTQLLDLSLPDVIGLSSLKLRVEESITHLQHWFRSNSLKMNSDKTHFTLLGTKASLKKISQLSHHDLGL